MSWSLGGPILYLDIFELVSIWSVFTGLLHELQLLLSYEIQNKYNYSVYSICYKGKLNILIKFYTKILEGPAIFFHIQ